MYKNILQLNISPLDKLQMEYIRFIHSGKIYYENLDYKRVKRKILNLRSIVKLLSLS